MEDIPMRYGGATSNVIEEMPAVFTMPCGSMKPLPGQSGLSRATRIDMRIETSSGAHADALPTQV
jgi:hypothetical protein